MKIYKLYFHRSLRACESIRGHAFCSNKALIDALVERWNEQGDWVYSLTPEDLRANEVASAILSYEQSDSAFGAESVWHGPQRHDHFFAVVKESL